MTDAAEAARIGQLAADLRALFEIKDRYARVAASLRRAHLGPWLVGGELDAQWAGSGGQSVVRLSERVLSRANSKMVNLVAWGTRASHPPP